MPSVIPTPVIIAAETIVGDIVRTFGLFDTFDAFDAFWPTIDQPPSAERSTRPRA